VTFSSLLSQARQPTLAVYDIIWVAGGDAWHATGLVRDVVEGRGLPDFGDVSVSSDRDHHSGNLPDQVAVHL
jgi:hypothetical protein